MLPSERELLDHLAYPAFVLEPDADGVPRYVALNKAGRARIGKTEEEIIGLTALEVWPGRLGQLVIEHQMAVMHTHKAVTFEVLLPAAEGRKMLRVTLAPILNAAGDVARIVGSGQEIHDIAAFREVNTEIETIASEMEDFLRMAAHDLRTPMINVKDIAELLRDGFQDLGDGKIELINLLEELGEKALSLINGVLSHAAAAKLEPENSKFDLGALIEEIMVVLDPQNTCDVGYPLGMVQSDRVAVQIVLRNLIDNALKHAKIDRGDGEGRLAVDIDVHEQTDGQLRIVVSDSGTGFDDPSVLFSPTGSSTAEGGYGFLGVRRLIAARGGKIKAATSDSGGAVVTFTLPGTLYAEDQAMVAGSEANRTEAFSAEGAAV